jgi:manganese/zinc/iron transport system substrate-binding protein
MRRSLVLLCAVTLASVISSCGRVGSEGAPARQARDLEPGEKIRVVTTIGMITDLVSNIGGERLQVTGLMGPGVDPHLYKASEGDVIRMAEADLVFYNGIHLEGKMAHIFEKMENRVATAAVTSGIDRSVLLAPPEFQGAYDPHVWFDVSLWIKAGEFVRDFLADFDPSYEESYRANAERYLAELARLHAYVQERASELPPEKRVIITAHDAFNYFGRAYGFEVRGLQGISTTAEAGTADVQSLAHFIVERGIPAIFVETSVSPRAIQALQEAVRSRGFRVEIGGNLYSDAMGSPGTPDGTYVGMVRHNIDTIVEALSREVPGAGE